MRLASRHLVPGVRPGDTAGGQAPVAKNRLKKDCFRVENRLIAPNPRRGKPDMEKTGRIGRAGFCW
jgi:hypothetical protein